MYWMGLVDGFVAWRRDDITISFSDGLSEPEFRGFAADFPVFEFQAFYSVSAPPHLCVTSKFHHVYPVIPSKKYHAETQRRGEIYCPSKNCNLLKKHCPEEHLRIQRVKWLFVLMPGVDLFGVFVDKYWVRCYQSDELFDVLCEQGLKEQRRRVVWK